MKKKAVIAAAIMLVVVVAAALVYSRPMTLAEICSEAEIGQSRSIEVRYFVAPAEDDTIFTIERGDSRIKRIVSAFEEKEFRRSAASLLPRSSSKAAQYEDGDFLWTVMFYVPADDGYKPLTVEDYFGEIEIRYGGRSWICSTDDREEWSEEVLNILRN